jgi:hypothetical protein
MTMRELQTPTAEEIAYAPDLALAQRIREGLEQHVEDRNEIDRRRTCPHCNPTAKAIRRVRDQWVVAGIGLD